MLSAFAVVRRILRLLSVTSFFTESMGLHHAGAKPFVGGGGGDIVSNVFVLGQRFDFATFTETDPIFIKGAVDELGLFRRPRKQLGHSPGFSALLIHLAHLNRRREQRQREISANPNCLCPAQRCCYYSCRHRVVSSTNADRQCLTGPRTSLATSASDSSSRISIA